MKLEIGKEYLYKGKKSKLVFVDNGIEAIEGSKFLVVRKLDVIGHVADWAAEGELKELSPYHDFRRGEPVMALIKGCAYRRYFSHVGDNGRPFCFCDTGTAWSSAGESTEWGSVRKLTTEEQEEYNKCL